MSEPEITTGSVSRVSPEESEKLALTAAKVIADNMGKHLIVLDMTELTALYDYHVIATGTSGRQLRAIAEEVEQTLCKELGEKRLSIAGKDDGHWVVQDFGTVIVHLFDAETRAYYSLENLWADAKQVDLSGVVPPEALEAPSAE